MLSIQFLVLLSFIGMKESIGTPFIGISNLLYQTLGIILLSTLEVAKVSKCGMACLILNKGRVNYSADSRTNTACLWCHMYGHNIRGCSETTLVVVRFFWLHLSKPLPILLNCFVSFVVSLFCLLFSGQLVKYSVQLFCNSMISIYLKHLLSPGSTEEKQVKPSVCLEMTWNLWT